MALKERKKERKEGAGNGKEGQETNRTSISKYCD
jgi:hypothetical protein